MSRQRPRIGTRSPISGAAVPPETKFARLGGDRIAYQVLGEGPPDLVLVRRSYGHIDLG